MDQAPVALHDQYMVPGLERGLRLLGLFDARTPELPLADIARKLAVPRSTAFRLAYTLAHLGFLKRTANGFRIGPKVMSLGFAYLASLDIVDLARPELIALRDVTGASAHLGILDGNEVVYIAQVPSLNQLASRISVGARFPAHAMSMGRLLLSQLSDEDLAELYPEPTLPALTADTPATLADLKRRMADDRERGFVISRGAYERGIIAVAAPIRNDQDEIIAAINISGPAAALDTPTLETDVKDRVVTAAIGLSRQLGYQG